MNLPRYALTHRVVVLAFLGIFLAVGLFNFASMSRREDPEITIREALVITRWPGASARRVDELITDPLEESLAQIAEIDKIRSKSMTGISVIQLTTGDKVQNTDQVWDDVRAKVSAVQGQLPPGSAPPLVNSDFGDVYEIVFTLHQTPLGGSKTIEHPYTPRQLERFAERIEDELQRISAVGKVDFWGVQRERIYIEVDSADWAKLGITPRDLRAVFAARNIVEPGGELDTNRARYAINTSLKSLVVLMTVPMAMIGVLLGLWITDWAMGFMAMLGLLALGGIVINNAIVLIDFIENALVRGVPLHEAAVTAGRLRVRPILLTTLTTIGSLLCRTILATIVKCRLKQV